MDKQSEKSVKTNGGKRPGAGRPRGAVNNIKKSLQELAAPHGEDMLNELISLAKSPSESGATRVAAIKELLDRGYGKASQVITGEGGTGPAVIQILTGVPRAD